MASPTISETERAKELLNRLMPNGVLSDDELKLLQQHVDELERGDGEATHDHDSESHHDHTAQ
jgi:hypothetical protein